jgi:hypothetical protein
MSCDPGHPAAPPFFLRLSPGQLAGLYIVVLVLVWSVLPGLIQSTPPADNIEQLNWAHALQWGYAKHPPLPTALLIGFEQVFGSSADLTYFLAMMCVGITLWMLWLCAKECLSPESALVALLLSSANYYLMGRGSFFNHNTVMAPFVAISVWSVLRIIRSPSDASWPIWLLLGLSQACGTLVKYQMALPIIANLACLLACGAHRQPRFAVKLTLASAATALPLVPHLLWLSGHHFSTFSYASGSLLASHGIGGRLHDVFGFVAQQIGRFAPALVSVGICLLIARKSSAPCSGTAQGGCGYREASGLPVSPAPVALVATIPGLCIVLLTLGMGSSPQNHWGATTTLLLPLLLVVWLPRIRQLSAQLVLKVVVGVQAVSVAWVAVAAHLSPSFVHQFPAQPLAGLADAYWVSHADGVSPQYVIGPAWIAGSIAIELPGHPAVMGNGKRDDAPWITNEKLAQCGALLIWDPAVPVDGQVDPGILAQATEHGSIQTILPSGRLTRLDLAVLHRDPNLSCTMP